MSYKGFLGPNKYEFFPIYSYFFSFFINVIAFGEILHIFYFFSLYQVVKDYIKGLEDDMQKMKSQDNDMNSLYLNNSSI